jgi:hypothetical protein
MIENLFVIFAPGLGGNHLANLIGLSDRFNRKYDVHGYRPGIKNAHMSSVTNLQEKTLLDNLSELQTQSNVFCGHLAEYLWIKEKQIDKFFVNRKFLIITFPEKNTPAYIRLLKICPSLSHEYLFYEQSSLYSIQYIKKLFEEHDFFTLGAENIFTEHIDQIVKFIESELYTNINVETATRLHNIWYNSVTIID